MSRVDELIAEMCPDGVEYLPLDSVTLDTANIKWSGVDDTDYKYIDLTSVDRIRCTVTDTQTINKQRAPSRAQQIVKADDIIFGTTRPMLKRYAQISAEYDGQICSTGFCVLRPDSQLISSRYLFHYLGTAAFYKHIESNERGASYPAVTDSAVKQAMIPLPPLPIQHEISNILDTFSKLEAELEAELEARKQQYEYYRDELLRFDDGVETRAFGTVAKIVRGASPRPIQKYLVDWTEGVPWIKIGDVPSSGKYITSTDQYVSIEGEKMSRTIHPGDFLLSNSMSFGRPYISGIRGCIHDGWLSISDFAETFTPDFLYHLLRSTPVQLEFSQRAGGGTVQNLNAEVVRSILLPIPPIEEQVKIASILDAFDALVNDLSSGLPAEIAARRQQYEHYRDRLLTFKEKTT